MDYDMESVEANGKDIADKSIDMEWQIDSEWINLSTTPVAPPSNNKKNKQIKQEQSNFENMSPPSFQLIPASKGGKYLVVDNQPLRLSQRKTSGYSYWVCSIPCCTARCVLDPDEKKIVRLCRNHNHEADVSRQEYKKFINALKISVKENPHVKPKALYDAEIVKTKERWRESKLKNNSNEEEPSLPSFDKVRTAMYNSRNAVLSSVSLKAVEEESGAASEAVLQAGPSRSTRTRDAKANQKRKSTPTKALVLSGSDLDELEDDGDETDEDWKASPTSSTNSKSNMEDVSFHFMPSNRGSQVLVIDGCLLHQNTIRASGKSYWRCQKKGCFYRAVYDPKLDKVTKTTGLHNHPPDSNQMMRRQFINNVKSQITDNPNVPPKQLYEKEVQKVKQELSELGVSWKIPPFSCVKHLAYRARKSAMNDDAEEEEDEISEEQPIKRQITETEKKFLEESVLNPQEEESGITMSLLSPGPAPIQSKNFPDQRFYFIPSKKGKRILVVNDFTFRLNSLKSGGRYYWKCTVDPCMFRCVYNESIQDIIKISGKHNHVTNVHKLRTREFCFLMKARMAEDPTLTPKKAYDREIAKIRILENGEQLVKCLPAYSSIRTSLYNQRHKRALEEEQGVLSGGGPGGSGYNNYYLGSSTHGTTADSMVSAKSLEQAQDISPKDITHLSLEDNDPMEHDEEDRGTTNTMNNNPMEIATPSLYDNHDMIDHYCETHRKVKISTKQEENYVENQVITKPEPSTYSVTFVPTTRGGRAIVVNGCVLRISYTREYVTYWRCQNNDCNFRCSYDSKVKKLLRISGEHNHPVNRYSPIIRTFVRKIKNRVSEEYELSPKIIYDEELERLKGDGQDTELLTSIPSYESLKSTLYKFKNRSVRTSLQMDETLDSVSDESEEERDEESLSEPSESTLEDELPFDPVIEEGFSTFNAQLPSWLDQDPDKHILDGHLLIKKSTTDTSSGWTCSKDGCPFRCVIDNDTKAVTRNQWDHTHKSAIKHIIAQAMFNAVKRRAVTGPSVAPKTIYEQEKKRIADKLSGNATLLKFIPSVTQVYQLVIKTRANPPPKLKEIKSKIPKQPKKKKSQKFSGSNNSNSSLGTGSNTSNGAGPYDTDYLLEHFEEDGERVSTYIEEQRQQNSLFEHDGSSILQTATLDSNSIPVYQHPSYHSNSYTNILSSNTSLPNSSKTIGQMEHQPGLNNFGSPPNKPPNFQSTLSHVDSNQTQPPPLILAVNSVSVQPSLQQTSHPAVPAQNLSLSPNSENVFTLHGYPLLPAMTQIGNIYWQCRVPGCSFQCVLNAGTSQIVQISGNHNHEPPGSHSAFCSQVVKMLQRKAAENLDEPLTSVYWEYMRSLRNVIDSEEILSGLPRFQDVALAMQNSRSAMGAVDNSHQFRNLVTGTANQTIKVFEYHFDAQSGSLVVNGDLLVLNWRMNELSYWKCKKTECRFKCTLDEELNCVHIMNPHNNPCPSSTQVDGKSASVKRKYPDKPSPRKPKFQRIDEMKFKSSN
ncbi:unnamed protein product [Lymnaea stagnalis]|uniref:FLYWCH-type domain-containing protein n=1 Tax=Lymnaea stagnalis TaxID=6523 RepID=A0AAV2HU25_LYMST